MTNRLSTALELIGLSVIAVAAFLVYPPAGIGVAGLSLVALGYALDRRSDEHSS
jgi:hypothetical protein